ncbi:DNA-binding transcriptional activator of the SARP family [Micromonospora citrea]|uniref:DNA-binding transcriptional activator of the SARP family n=1 Tax=Micromonospora citrea TaxID=47855 RepID=A0A1C6VZD6_9ACTN|nr:AfsR/SARP family transcriptional regulator [Micromonospora citrea]SCL71557.1 DNA-binding transcriptional activator of the SARP family [Micromonospora citrea]
MSHAVIDLHLLGPVTATRDGTEIPLGAPQQRTMLAALLMEPGRVVPVDDLIDAVWGQRAPAAARKAVQVYASRLRHALPTLDLRGRPPGYLLDVAPDRVDVHRFRALVRAAGAATGEHARELLRRALTQWRGAVPLAGLGEAPLAQSLVPVLVEERLAALHRRIALDLDAGRHHEVVSELVALTTAHPYRESVHGLLMRALHGTGRSAEAVAAYRALDRRLARELGTEPGPQLRRLYASIRRGHAASPPEADVAHTAGRYGTDVERIDDPTLVADRLWSVTRDAHEVLTVQPDRGAHLETLLRLPPGQGRAGSGWRTIVHRRLASRSAGAHQGGERHRAAEHPVQWMVLVDRRIAFLSGAPGDGRRGGALVIRNPGVVAALADLFERSWAGPVDVEAAGGGPA